ncbi:MAG: galactose mutarotase [Rhodobacteraceae bacterium]|nr:galactose mutarotase [Paracoccaceae bacterium]
MTAFGALADGRAVERLRISGGGLTADVLTYGTVIQNLCLEGHDKPLVLGFPEFAPYLTHSPYFGATAGRCANRIRDGHLELARKTYQLDRNFLGKHSLHGGLVSMGKRLWAVDNHSAASVTFAITLEDGEMGYPGKLDATVTYSLLDGGVLDVVMRARTDAPTLCNMAHHSYFNLGSDHVGTYLMRIAADAYLPVDDELIPTGEIRPVDGTGMDFREYRPVGDGSPIDHNFCLAKARGAIRPVAWLADQKSSVSLEVRTTEPGLQVYDSSRVNIAVPGLVGAKMGAYCGIALEPQVWPDANHHPAFPQAVLLPGEDYVQHTQFVFTKDTL